MVQTFRLYGPEVGINTAVVDADVTGVSMNGAIELTPQDNSFSTFTMETEQLRSLAADNLAYDADSVSDGPLWKAIEDVENRFNNASGNGKPFIDASRVLFQGAQ